MSYQTGRDAIIPDISSCLPIFRPPQLHQNRENTAPLPNARPGIQGGQAVKRTQWKTVAISLLTVLLLLALVFLVFRGHAREILQNLRAVPVVWLPVLFGLPLLYQALEAAVCRALLRKRLPDFSFRQAAEVIFLGVFGNVSTFAAGTVPMQSYYLYRRRLNPGSGVGIMTLEYAFHKASILLYATALLLPQRGWFQRTAGELTPYLLAGPGLRVESHPHGSPQGNLPSPLLREVGGAQALLGRKPAIPLRGMSGRPAEPRGRRKSGAPAERAEALLPWSNGRARTRPTWKCRKTCASFPKNADKAERWKPAADRLWTCSHGCDSCAGGCGTDAKPATATRCTGFMRRDLRTQNGFRPFWRTRPDRRTANQFHSAPKQDMTTTIFTSFLHFCNTKRRMTYGSHIYRFFRGKHLQQPYQNGPLAVHRRWEMPGVVVPGIFFTTGASG